MLGIRSSHSKGRNPDFKQSRRKKVENNLKWIERHKPDDERPCLVLLGGTSVVDFRLRVSQSHARQSLTPSHWSHVVLLQAPGTDFAAAKTDEKSIFEISLQPENGFGFPPKTNAVQESDIKRYADQKVWPNCAMIYLPHKMDDILRIVKRFTYQRSALDAVDLVLSWLAYVWGTGRSVNPLVDGKGIPSATMVEYVLGGLQYELTPGLDSRSSCPEAIWQSALWWHDYYTESGGKKLEGAWVVDHGLVEEQSKSK